MRAMDTAAFRRRVEEHIRAGELIPPGGEVVCLVSGGADSTCLWHVLGELGYRVSALHVNHGLRGAESDEDAEFCRELLGAEVVEAPGHDRGGAPRPPVLVRDRPAAGDRSHGVRSGRDRPLPPRLERQRRRDQGEARGRRRPAAPDRLAGRDGGVLPRRGDPVPGRLVEPGHEARADPRPDRAAAPELDERAEKNLLALAEGRPSRLDALLASTAGSARVDLGGGLQAVREYDRVWLERGARPACRRGAVGALADHSLGPGLQVRGWRAGDRLANRSKKFRMCSWTRRCPGPSGRRGRSSCAATRSSPCRGSSRRRA